MFAIHISDKGFESKINEEFSNKKKQINEEKIWIATITKEKKDVNDQWVKNQ